MTVRSYSVPDAPGHKTVQVISFPDRNGLTQRFTIAGSPGNRLIKRGVVGKHGITDGARFGRTNDGHMHWVAKTHWTGKPGYRDDVHGSAAELGLRGRPWGNRPNNPYSTRAVARAARATAGRVDVSATALSSIAASASTGAASWADVARVADRLQADTVNLHEAALDLVRRSGELGVRAGSAASEGLAASARAASAAAEASSRIAAATAEEASKAAHRAADAAARAARLAAEQAVRGVRVVTEATVRAARAMAEAAARAAAAAAEAAARTAAAAAEATVKAAIAVAAAVAAIGDR